eukprot:gene14584-biopygen2093
MFAPCVQQQWMQRFANRRAPPSQLGIFLLLRRLLLALDAPRLEHRQTSFLGLQIVPGIRRAVKWWGPLLPSLVHVARWQGQTAVGLGQAT